MCTLSIPNSVFNHFLIEWHNGEFDGLRLGQAFHKYMQMDKLTSYSNKIFADRLYNATDAQANKMIASRLDYNS